MNYKTSSWFRDLEDGDIDAVIRFFADKGYDITADKTSDLLTVSWENTDDE